MSIPETQLASWTGQGSIAGSERTYASVKSAIDAWPQLNARGIDVFLQGSYRNSTNIRGESDVDVVVHCPQTFYFDVSQLSVADQQYVNSLPPATYQWEDFRNDVHSALLAAFGSSNVIDGNKCLKVWQDSDAHITADVLPAFTHRVYKTIWIADDGIAFLTRRERRRIVNFPKQHHDNGVRKNQTSYTNFKPAVRMYKNATERAIDLGYLAQEDAGSYCVECAVSNVPDQRFIAPTWQMLFWQVYDYLTSADWRYFMCLNGLLPLLGAGPDEWAPNCARNWLAGLNALWLNS